MRGVQEGYDGELFGSQAEAIRDILDVFGEDGLRAYLMGVIEGEEDAKEDEEDAQAEPKSDDEDEDDLLDDEDFGQEPNPNSTAVYWPVRSGVMQLSGYGLPRVPFSSI